MGTKLHVGNLHHDTTAETLRAHVARGGREIASLQLLVHSSNRRSRGFAFVEMASETDAAATISELNGQELDGRALTVSAARENPTPRPRSLGKAAKQQLFGGGGTGRRDSKFKKSGSRRGRF